VDALADGIRERLRATVRMLWELRKPVVPIRCADARQGPAYVVAIDGEPCAGAAGVRLEGLKHLSIPNQRVLDQVHVLATRIQGLRTDLEACVRAAGTFDADGTGAALRAIDEALEFRICADLARVPPHAPTERTAVVLGQVMYDIRSTGPVDVIYDRDDRVTALFVTTPMPVCLRVELLAGSETLHDDALAVLSAALDALRPALDALGFGAADAHDPDLARFLLD
jgi:hypothetical protein